MSRLRWKISTSYTQKECRPYRQGLNMTVYYNLFDFNSAPRQNAKPEHKDPASEFRRALEAAGLLPGEVSPDGVLRRCGTADHPKRLNGAYKMFADGRGGWFENHADGQGVQFWTAAGCKPLTPGERIEIKRANTERQRAEAETRAAATAAARKYINDLNPATDDNPYLARKGVHAAAGLLADGDVLVVPVLGEDNNPISFQKIIPAGGKRFALGAPVAGGFFAIGPKDGNLPLLIGEGIATCLSLYESTGFPCLAAFSAGNLKAVAKMARKKYPDRKIILCGDNDLETETKTGNNPGVDKAKAAAVAINGLLAIPDAGGDFNDLHQTQGLEAVKTVIDAALQKQESANPFKRKVIIADDIDARFLDSLKQGWRIKGILREAAYFNGIYGPPGSYKSFIVLDMALSISSGCNWQGREVKPCSVAYVAAEGQYGLLKRIKAWKIHHGVENIGSFALYPIPAIVDDPSNFGMFIESLRELPEMPNLVFIDTLARSMAGDENQTADMGRVVLACSHLSIEFGIQVVFVHHTGKDKKRGLRGSISLEGATDTLISIEKIGEQKAKVICERQKDDEPFDGMIFSLEKVDTGFVNEDLEPVTSLVPVYSQDATLKANDARPHLSTACKIALKALSDAVNELGQEPDEYLRSKQNCILSARVVALDEWRQWAYAAGISPGDQNAKRQAFHRIRNQLLERKYIECWDDLYWIRDVTTN